tara:strand:- start:82 stop:294 length:213 start_codon:yes stop_codon:yes gene_type:complete
MGSKNLFHDIKRLLWQQIDSSMALSELREKGEGRPLVSPHATGLLEVLALMEIAESLEQIKDTLKEVNSG